MLYFFLTTPDKVLSNSSDNCIHRYNVEILNLFDPELQLINTKQVIKKQIKRLLSNSRKFKVQTILVLDYKKRMIVIASDLDIDEAFKSMHQSIMTKIKNYACEDLIVLDAVIMHSIKIFECQYQEKKWVEQVIYTHKIFGEYKQ